LQRRKFIQITGITAAAWLTAFKEADRGRQIPVMRLPDEVSVRSGGEWHTLSGQNEIRTLEDIFVVFREDRTLLSVFITSPKHDIDYIRCNWKMDFSSFPKSLNDQWERTYGDLSWAPLSAKRRSPWYILLSDGAKTKAFGVRTQASSFCSWQVSPSGLELQLDTMSGGTGVQLGDRPLHAADIMMTESLPGENPFHTDIRFCKMMCPSPKLPDRPVYGINDWYFAYGNNSRDLILERTAAMSELVTNWINPPFSVIDMGWSYLAEPLPTDICQGDDFTQPNKKFGDMERMADDIKKRGMLPGLWTRPLLASSRNTPDGLIPLRKDQSNKLERYLDPTIPENLQKIKETIGLYQNWGFRLTKHDYTSYDLFGRWGFDMGESITAPGWNFNDRSVTNAEIVLLLYRAIRSAASEMYLLGCNTFSHLSAGIFELNRTGDDTSGKEWSRTLKMGVNTLGFRLPQHNTFYAVDGDCVGLTTRVPWEKNVQWLQLLAESSAPLFISAQPEAIGPEQKSAITLAFKKASDIQPLGEPLDWMSNPKPKLWLLNGEKVEFEW